MARVGPAAVAAGALGAGMLAASTVAAADTTGPVFRPGGTSYAVGNIPGDSTAADLDGDGDNDLAVANEGSQSVSVLRNNGGGSFAPRKNYPTGSNPLDIVAADFNSDGAPDLAVTTGFGGGSILLNNGDGTFAAPQGINGFTYGVALTAGDFNNDGNTDLVVSTGCCSTDHPLKSLLGNGDGTFYQPEGPTYNGYTYPYTYYPAGGALGVTSADLNGDGNLDLALRGSTNLTPVLGNGNGKFHDAPQPTYHVVDHVSDYVPAMTQPTDFNGDGLADIALTITSDSTADTTVIFMGNGDGTFTRGQSHALKANPSGLAAADFTGDGAIDLVVAKSPGRDEEKFPPGKVTVLVGAGDGTFQPTTTGPPSYKVGPYPQGLTAADLTGDNRPDLVTANTGNPSDSDTDTVTVLSNTAG